MTTTWTSDMAFVECVICHVGVLVPIEELFKPGFSPMHAHCHDPLAEPLDVDPIEDAP